MTAPSCTTAVAVYSVRTLEPEVASTPVCLKFAIGRLAVGLFCPSLATQLLIPAVKSSLSVSMRDAVMLMLAALSATQLRTRVKTPEPFQAKVASPTIARGTAQASLRGFAIGSIRRSGEHTT